MSTQVAASSRAHGSKSTDQCRREMVCNLLTQIFLLAERTRVSKRSVSDAEAEPISLIELIQASYLIFERYGIGPPDDAVYHRYLLSLSINPERDWRKKILNLDLGAQPRVKRLCTGHRRAVESLDSGAQRRQKTEKDNTVRGATLVSDYSTPVRKSTLKSGFVFKEQRQHDRFGDMLSLDSPIQKIPVNDNEIVFPRPPTAENTEERQLQMITTSMEQWQATQAVKQLNLGRCENSEKIRKESVDLADEDAAKRVASRCAEN
ncbi:hypothetical protein F444_16753 [Phytophthora nicotianae P1976]|uniref:Uncharacterized protein n=1 Tax=Phytophthora nicotianae P1976 TaxID=1317066 RepID=A0A080ZH72_PHYNI|nr:hypothetical protein F444_16753 [Phytophthora nicotianae P1976]